ncbi:hypothetical protein FD733_08910 [Pantoea sp. Eser]|nr:hypothetical protein [Pantoea sp. Eser]
MEIIRDVFLNIIAGASGAYDPAYAGARQSQRGSNSAGSNGSHDIYAGTDSCVTSIGLGALGGIKGGLWGALLGVMTTGYGACVGSSNNGSGGGSSQSGAGDCSGGIGSVCN